MKLNNKVLHQIFSQNIKNRIPGTRKDCPSPKQMLQVFRQKKSEKKKTKIIEHITNCYYCTQEFEFIIKALRFEEDLNREIQKVFKPKKIDASSMHFSWKWASLIAGVIFICIITTIFNIPNTNKNQKLRASNLPQISLYQPKENDISKSSLFFQWENIKECEYYTFELYDDSLYQIWGSNNIYNNHFVLSKDIASRLEAYKNYFWMISAFFPNGTKIESPLKEFFLTE